MMALLKFHWLQVVRSRLLILWTVFCFLAMYAVIKILHSVTVQYQETQTMLRLQDIVVALLYSQLAAGSVLATVYGIWTVPYLHEENRAPLTYSLPIPKEFFPVVYFLSFLILFGIQIVGLFASLSLQMGPSILVSPDFPWGFFGAAMLHSVLALEVTVLFLAVIALYFGKVQAFMGGTTLILVLQISGALFRAGLGQESLWKKIYSVLPPMGEVFFDLSRPLSQSWVSLVLWVLWLVVLSAAFRLRLARA